MTGAVCTRCRGKGFGDWVREYGVCFGCQGKGTRVAQLAIRDRARAEEAYRAAVAPVSLTIAAPSRREAQHAFIDAYYGTVDGTALLPVWTEVEPGLFAAEERWNLEAVIEWLARP